MIDATAILAPETEIQRGDTIVLDEGTEIGTGTERADAEIGAVAGFLAIVCAIRKGDGGELLPFPDGKFGFGIRDIASNVVDKFFEGVGTFGIEIAAAVCVRIDIGNCMLH